MVCNLILYMYSLNMLKSIVLWQDSYEVTYAHLSTYVRPSKILKL